MNTKIRFKRFVFALVLALSTLVFATSTALAQKPVKTEYTIPPQPITLEGICSFPIVQVATASVTETDFFDQSGSLIRMHFHLVEQDTFTANGNSLVGMPYAFNFTWLFDSEGNLTYCYMDGVLEKIWLPDGSLFISAGRVDWDIATRGIPVPILSPDKGNPGNIAGFCKALAP